MFTPAANDSTGASPITPDFPIIGINIGANATNNKGPFIITPTISDSITA